MSEIRLITLTPGWYEEVKVVGVDKSRPGIYEWRIEGIGVYIGQYTSASRPLFEYGNNVRKILNGLPYRKRKPEKFRPIHRQLAQAVRNRHHVMLTLLENIADKPTRNRRERELIAERRREELQGGVPVLNKK